MRELDARQRHGGGPMRLEAQHGSAAAPDRPVVLLDDIVQVLAVADQDVYPRLPGTQGLSGHPYPRRICCSRGNRRITAVIALLRSSFNPPESTKQGGPL